MSDIATARALRGSVVADTIRSHRLVVVLRRVAPVQRLRDLVDELAEAGARIFEITFDSSNADDDLAAIRRHLAARLGGPYLVGAGTVLSLGQLDLARRAGADFAVAPTLDPEVVHRSVSLGLPFIAGALSPTEIRAAWSTGATFVKLFPASVAGPELVRELRGPLSEIELIPTGGVDGANAPDFLAAGAVAVGIGSALVRAEPDDRRRIVASVTGR